MRELQKCGEPDERGGREQDDDLSRLESSLREALRPVEPPVGFAMRVRERLDGRGAVQPVALGAETPSRADEGRARTAERVGPVRAFIREWPWRMAIAAMLLLTVLLGGLGVWERQQRRERAEAARVKAQFELAMQVTVRSLSKVGRDLERRSARGEVQ